MIGENGVGKSSVIDAISFGLYGRPIRNVNKPQLLNSITQKGLLVEVEFSIGDKSYLVRRGMKPSIFEIYVNGTLLNQDAQSRDYQDVLENQILRLNHKSFCQIVVLSVANYTPFMALTASARREVIEDLLDIQIFSAMNVLLKDKIAENKASLTQVDYDIALIQSKIEMTNERLSDLSQSYQGLIYDRNASISKAESEIEAHSKGIVEAEKQLAAYEVENRRELALRDEITEAETLARTAQSKLKRLQKEIAFYEHSDSCPTCKQTIDPTFKSDKLSEKRQIETTAQSAIAKIARDIDRKYESLKEFRGLSDNMSALMSKIAKHNEGISVARRVISNLQTEIISLRAKISNLRADDSDKNALQNELSLANVRKMQYTSDREIFNIVAQLLKDGGIKAQIIRQYIPILNKLILKFLAALDFFVRFEFDDQFRETIKSRYRDDFTTNMFSQGEKLRLDLAILFAFRGIAKLRNSSSTNILFFDEILDSSLDLAGTEDFISLISRIDDCNIFVISHRGDQIADRFNEVIRFEKNQNFSRITKKELA